MPVSRSNFKLLSVIRQIPFELPYPWGVASERPQFLSLRWGRLRRLRGLLSGHQLRRLSEQLERVRSQAWGGWETTVAHRLTHSAVRSAVQPAISILSPHSAGRLAATLLFAIFCALSCMSKHRRSFIICHYRIRSFSHRFFFGGGPTCVRKTITLKRLHKPAAVSMFLMYNDVENTHLCAHINSCGHPEMWVREFYRESTLYLIFTRVYFTHASYLRWYGSFKILFKSVAVTNNEQFSIFYEIAAAVQLFMRTNTFSWKHVTHFLWRSFYPIWR